MAKHMKKRDGKCMQVFVIDAFLLWTADGGSKKYETHSKTSSRLS